MLGPSLRMKKKWKYTPPLGSRWPQAKEDDKEALFNVAYNETDNISSRAILRHNNAFNRY